MLTDVRTGGQEGYDRVVMEFRGSAVPGFQVRYDLNPRLEGSGDPVRLDGGAALVVTADRTTYPGEGSDYYAGPNRLDGPGGSVTDVVVGGTFEGYTDIYVGVADEARPYRVFTLTDPPRVVVDVAASSSEG
ncbi:hypothetical protein KLP28_00455 [Nocardioidaceae bacterium]|nr:hypothetical protein KLP28_00455 [Nocardioidaceae bacterium]